MMTRDLAQKSYEIKLLARLDGHAALFGTNLPHKRHDASGCELACALPRKGGAIILATRSRTTRSISRLSSPSPRTAKPKWTFTGTGKSWPRRCLSF